MFTPRERIQSIVPCASGYMVLSNFNAPMQAYVGRAPSGPCSHGLSTHSVESGTPRAWNCVTSSTTSSELLYLSRHFVSANCRAGGKVGMPTRWKYEELTCSGDPA